MNFMHAAFAPYRQIIDALDQLRSIDSLNTLSGRLHICHDNDFELRFVASNLPTTAAAYESGIHGSGRIPTRESNLHDWLNALVWLRMPRFKSALNRRHCQELEHAKERKQRGKLRDQLTLLDESGVLVASPRRDLLSLLQEKRWVELFWEARADVMSQMTFVVVGHGLLEKCTSPFAGMTGKCLLMETDETRPEVLDKLAANRVQQASMLSLPPLPVLGIPGWDDNDSVHYYENVRVFRPMNANQRPTPQTTS